MRAGLPRRRCAAGRTGRGGVARRGGAPGAKRPPEGHKALSTELRDDMGPQFEPRVDNCYCAKLLQKSSNLPATASECSSTKLCPFPCRYLSSSRVLSHLTSQMASRSPSSASSALTNSSSTTLPSSKYLHSSSTSLRLLHVHLVLHIHLIPIVIDLLPN